MSISESVRGGLISLGLESVMDYTNNSNFGSAEQLNDANR